MHNSPGGGVGLVEALHGGVPLCGVRAAVDALECVRAVGALQEVLDRVQRLQQAR